MNSFPRRFVEISCGSSDTCSSGSPGVFVKGWIGENSFAQSPMALYGFILLLDAISCFILQYQIFNLVEGIRNQ